MKPHERRQLAARTPARKRQASSTLFYIPEDHYELELSLKEHRASGFNDPIRLRSTNTGGFDGLLEEGYDES